MEYGRLSSLFWQQLDREKKPDAVQSSSSNGNGETSSTLSVSEWDALTSSLVDLLPQQSLEKELSEILFSFRQLVKKNLEPEATHDHIDEIAASSFKILRECSVRMVGKKEKDALRKVFYTADIVDSFSQAGVSLIRRLCELFSEECWNDWKTRGKQQPPHSWTKLMESLQNGFAAQPVSEDVLSMPSHYGTKTSQILEEIKQSFLIEPPPSLLSKTATAKPEVSKLTRSQPPAGASGDLVRLLLNTQFVSPDGSDLSLDDFIPVVESLLVGEKSEEALQSELCEILGFHNFDLITSLLVNRSAVRRNVENRKQNTSNANASRNHNDKQRGKNRKKGDIKESDITYGFDEESVSNFDDDYAVQLQMQELRASQRESIRTYERPRYPYVFDQMAEAKQSAAFIQSAKILLPDHTVRQTKLYEEYNVAAPSKSTLPRNLPPLIHIVDMDEIIRNLFTGYETLNRIQSMVYTTAYTTNENMLVCAPTGAGKTNTAMLCIAREISQNLGPDGVLDKNLKIVYVAPMKALASEMVRTFTERLKFYKLRVEEVTGDTNVNKFDLEKTQMIITTPEKWDVITRKSVGDTKLVSQVSLLIIDEIHLLNDERGPVIESLVARTFHMIEENQKMVRILGLSATLPNYVDVADFLRVNKEKAMFFFDGRFRPVPLEQTFIGMKQQPNMKQDQAMYEVLYEKLLDHVRKGYQVLVFVHARNQTHKVANTIREMAIEHGELDLFRPNENEDDYDNRNVVSRAIVKQMQDHASRSTNRELKVLLPDGLAIHHAGMVRSDRSVVERMFKEGGVRTLVCTATLAWGVNLPAHAVIIFGTKIYKPEKGSFEDIDVLDVQQIFGRAGRPQYDTSGHGIIITGHDSMPKFLKMMTSSQDIESQLPNHLLEHLNAEIVLRNVSNVNDAVQWLRCTYLFQRVSKNPLMYGFDRKKASEDLAGYTRKWFEEKVHTAGRELDKARLVRYDEKNGFFHPTQFGNIASWFYIDVKTMQVFSDPETGLREMMQEYEILALVCRSSEFSQIKVRNEELPELDEWKNEYTHFPGIEGVDNSEGKVSVLIQSYISRCVPRTHSLSSDMYYCQQNAARILRAVFQMAMYKNWSSLASKTLNLCLFVENRLWEWDHALKQFGIDLPMSVYQHLEQKKLSIERLKDLDEGEIGVLVHNRSAARKIKSCADQYPVLDVEATAKPIGNAVIQINLLISPKFVWNDTFLSSKRVLNFWIWAEDPNNSVTFHTEEYALQKVKVLKRESDKIEFIIPSYGSHEILIHVRSDRFLHSQVLVPVYLRGLLMPKHVSFKTELLDLQPLPTTALQDPLLQSLYPFQHFNPIQTQVFHTLMHTDLNVLLGAPTGSGKTIAAEFAIFRALRLTKCKVVYIAPLKALVRERVADWKQRLEKTVGWKVVELTGDTAPDIRSINAADVIIATPEKWDGISRSWQHRSYVQDVKLLVFDEIHMLGEDRGPVIEVIVSRTNFIASFTRQKVRIVGLSTALASADDVANWLGIRPAGLFNFSSAVRPVPLVQHISGYPGKHYCPRMALMNKPTYQAIRTHSAGKPVLIFVSSRRQTRLTGFALLSFASMEFERGREWMTMTDDQLTQVTAGLKDNDLKQLVMYGIGIHHAGLHERDRVTVEHLFLTGKILILIATATLAWGVNFPAHLVVIKGTEFYDGKTKQYVKYPLTDVLQMAGRAGRPQFDNEGVAVILCHEPLKNYYMKFLHNPLPVESQLQDVLADHINAEIVAGTLTTLQSTMEYLTWTYFYRRLLANPDYYSVKRQQASAKNGGDVNGTEEQPVALVDIQKYLREIIMECLGDLVNSHCVEYYQSPGQQRQQPDFVILPTYLGTISSYYYLKHGTMRILNDRITAKAELSDLLLLLSDVKEFDDMPVRHNEDAENGLLSKKVPLPIEMSRFDDPHAKVFLLLQVYFSRNQIAMPHVDYATDLKTALDQVMRVVQAMIDVAAQKGFLATTLRIMQLSQMLNQGQWIGTDPFYTLPFSDSLLVQALRKIAQTLPELVAHACAQKTQARLKHVISSVAEPGKNAEAKILEAINSLPVLRIKLRLMVNRDEEQEEATPPSIEIIPGRRNWIPVPCGATCTLDVSCTRLVNRWLPGKKTATSRFPKPKDESWWLVVGEPEKGELCAMKRIGFIGHKQNSSLLIPMPSEPRRLLLQFYLMSDSYFQFDQQIPIFLEAVAK